jgi:UDP-glucose 4-epimerase
VGGGVRAFVTGATGFIGSHLARTLRAEGVEVHAIRRSAAAATRLPCDGIQWHTADLLEPGGLAAAVERARPSVVFHLAAYGTVIHQRDEAAAFAVNVQGAWNLWRALKGHSCRLVVAGSCGEYGRIDGPSTEAMACEPTGVYPATKNAAATLLKALARENGREAVVLRLYGPYGEADDTSRVIPALIDRLLRQECIDVTAGDQRRDVAHVDDHVQALLRAARSRLSTPVATYNIGSGRAIALRSVFEVVADAVGGDARRRIRAGALPYRAGETMWMCADIAAARADLGYEPRIELREGVARTVAWYRTTLAGVGL